MFWLYWQSPNTNIFRHYKIHIYSHNGHLSYSSPQIIDIYSKLIQVNYLFPKPSLVFLWIEENRETTSLTCLFFLMWWIKLLCRCRVKGYLWMWCYCSSIGRVCEFPLIRLWCRTNMDTVGSIVFETVWKKKIFLQLWNVVD